MLLALLATGAPGLMAVEAQAKGCLRVTLAGDVSAGKEWRAAIGEGWVLRVMPIAPASNQELTGWDLVVDREKPAGYPDAVLLSTPPYDSINEREVGTSFGMRAQDAIGWNPRSFRFITDPALLRRTQESFLHMQMEARSAGDGAGKAKNAGQPSWMTAVLAHSSAGQFRILDARLTPGTADAAPFAQNWAVASARTPHSFEAAPGGKATPLGTLNWIKFSVSLWLPKTWRMPAGLPAMRDGCSE